MRYKTLLVWLAVVAGMIGERHRYLEYLRSFAPFWRVLIIVVLSVFMAATLIWACGLEFLFFQLFNIQRL